MKIAWYYNRLRAMSVPEILWRIKRLLWQYRALVTRKYRQIRYESNTESRSNLSEVLAKVRFYGLADIEAGDVPDKWIDSTVDLANKLLQHRYEYLALGEIELGKEINWNHEYKRNIDTPLEFGPWMDYRDTSSFGDFKYFWELPRLQHLITLAKAYFLTGSREYADEVVLQLEGFVKQSPYLLGVNWIMPMEATIRLVSLSWIAVFIRDYLKDHARACVLIDQIVTNHTDYITSNYAAYSSANNHLVGEAAGVFISSICFYSAEKSRKHMARAYEILCHQICNQHYQDGVNKEQAVHYQLFAFNFFLLAGVIGRDNGIDFPGQYWDMLEKSADFLAAIADDNCCLPQIGDSDDGKAIVLSENQTNPVHSVLATSAVLFDRADFKEKAGSFDETSFWLLGKEARKKFEDMPASSAPDKKAFEQGGYYILGVDDGTRAKIIFDCGPLGFGQIAAHGHADSLSFVLNAYGREFLVDPGTYTYIASDPYRNYFRSTRAHNTIAIDHTDQSTIGGAFLWAQKACSFVDEFVSNDDYDRITGWHNGYHRLSDPVTHKRTLTFCKKDISITVDDYLTMKGQHRIEQFFHLGPDCQTHLKEENVWTITNSGKEIELTTDKKLNSIACNGSDDPISGWFSDSYDRKCPSTTLLCHGVFTGEQRFTTRIKL